MGKNAEFNLNNASEYARLQLFIANLGKEVDSETHKLVNRIARNYHLALKRNTPEKTGNMKSAIFANYNSGTGKGARGFINIGNFPGEVTSSRAYVGFKSNFNEKGIDALDYVLAQDEGSYISGKTNPWMLMDIPISEAGPRSRKVFERGTKAYLGIAADHREIYGQHFIEESQREALARVQIETAKFMRQGLINN